MPPISGYALYAFDTLVSALEGTPAYTLQTCLKAVPDSVILTGMHPLFVTWNRVDSKGRTSLRGCIGTFQAQKLAPGLATYALTAALEDTRFAPIKAKELPHLECGVTILGNFEECKDAYDWEIGTHGIQGTFISKSGRRTSATFLPDVAVEQEWDQDTTLEYLADKAGASADAELKLTRYTGEKSSIRYNEYIKLIKIMEAAEEQEEE